MFALTNGESADDGGPVPFGPAAKAWFERVLRAHLRGKYPSWSLGGVDGVVEVFAEDAERFVQWVDAGEWKGGDYTNGAWELNIPEIECAVAHLVKQWNERVAREDDAKNFRTLDAWLRADLRGDLAYRGCEGGSARLPDEVRAKLREAREQRELVRDARAVVRKGRGKRKGK